ncbi:class I adenylate-forming enzyme family protein [Streptomyces xiaopingdaonensis]|uniref:class I adenylate-forming enzyme family protein n=1 Tax=Streptomyces xiaopingdaonensis TaxID=1565415 RepID=UPI000317EC46|nr:class I adenylate-forming enzyme family protein [Streptomyces xiaopingdaonensis]
MRRYADPAAALTELTAPGAEFEIHDESVRGATMPVFRHRHRSLRDLLAASAARGEAEYLVTADRRLTFAQHAAQAASLARALRDGYGVGKGDRVAVLAANCPEWVVAFWAAQALGAVVVAFNSWWSPREVAYALGHSTPSVVVADAARAQLLDGCRVPVLTVEEDLPRLVGDADAPLPQPRGNEDDPAVIVYTSGTTGRPKGAVHSHRNLLAVVEYLRLSDAVAAAAGAAGPHRYLLTSPLFHIASLHNLAVPRLATGSTVVMHQGAFDAARVLRLIESERVTHWGAVPTMAQRLLDAPDLDRYDLSSLTAVALASAPSSDALKRRLRQALPAAAHALVDSYGLTETSTSVAVAAGEVLRRNPGSVGYPTVTVAVEIRGPLSEALPEGEDGEIHVRSPFNMLGYWQDEEATESVLDGDGWLRTGDIGRLERGMLWLAARRSDLILRGGENVYPAEVEYCLEEHPGVAECAVLGSPHEDLGEEVAAVVVVRAEHGPTQAELHAFARERLAYFKVPSRWRLTREPLPRNATGKVLRRDLCW